MKQFRLRFAVMVATAALLQACAAGDPNVESAKLNIRNKDYSAAIVSTDKAIANNPENADAYVWKARALSSRAAANRDIQARVSDYEAMNGALNKASEILKKSTDPKSTLALLQVDEVRDNAWRFEHATGVNYVNKDSVTSDDMQMGINHMKNAVAIYPDSTLSTRVLSEIYFMSGNTAEAANYLNAVLSKPGVKATAEDFVRLVFFLRESGQKEQAYAKLEQAMAAYPDSKEIKIEKANTELSDAEYSKAATTMSEIVGMDPTNAEYRYIYATLLFEAINTEISKLNDNYTLIFDKKSEYREVARQRTSNAQKKQLAEIEKQMADINVQNDVIGQEISRLGDVVINQLSEAVKLDSTTAKYHALLGNIYDVKANVLFNKGNEESDFAKAEQIQNEAKEIWKKALPELERATQMEPNNKDYWSLLGKIYLRLGMNEEAEKAMQKAEQ